MERIQCFQQSYSGVVRSLDPSLYANNKDVCDPPFPTVCTSPTSTDSDSNKSGKSNEMCFGTVLIIVNVIGLIVLLVLFIVSYKKLRPIRREPRRKNSIV